MSSIDWAKVDPTVDFRAAVTADEGLQARATEARETGTLEKGRQRRGQGGASRAARFWRGFLDLAYVAWVVRVPLIALLVGVMLMGFAPQAQDLLVDLAQGWRLLSFLLLVAVWVAVTTYASFLLLGTDRRLLDYSLALKSSDSVAYRRLERFRTAMPYVLGTLPFAIVFIAASRSLLNLPDIEDGDALRGARWVLYRSIGYAVVLMVLFGYLSWARPKAICGLLDKAEAAAKRLNDRMPKWLTFGIPAAGPNPAVRTRHYVGPLVLFVVFAASAFTFFILGPNVAADWLPRALIIPVVLGGWLPLLTWLSAHGRRLRAPLISGILLVLAIMSAGFGDNHSVRRVNTAEFTPAVRTAGPAAPRKPHSTMKLNNAVRLWMDENGCRANPAQCPRPIIVAGAGGASRAGFFTASVIGLLMNNAEKNVSLTMDAGVVKNRIFAISGVSGGAVGAVMTVAAMARAGDDTKQPCTNRNPTLWYGDTINNWQDCLEALTAGDFLTPVMLGLIFNDRIDFGLWQDRAAVLEQSWENRFADLTGAADDPNWKARCPGDLRCAFTMLRPERGRWLPLLVLNGTSATTGRRIVTSILEPQYGASNCPTRAPTQSKKELEKQADLIRGRAQQDQPAFELAGAGGEHDECLLFLESKPFHELLLEKQRKAGWREKFMSWLGGFDSDKTMDDITLSTAAHNSARFPLISPPGAVRNFHNQVIDRIVDGGYVDNYGALTALELAQAIHAIEPRLAPFVLTVSNDPDENPDLNPLDAPDGTFLSDITIPIETVMNARTGHGRLAMGQVEAVLDHLADPACGAQTAHVRVWPQFAKMDGDTKVSRPVSMSWWLSKPIQIHLHQQTEGTRNQNQNHAEVEKAWTALDKPPGCVGQQAMTPSAAEAQQRAKAR